jgi:hypothetical protein
MSSQEFGLQSEASDRHRRKSLENNIYTNLALYGESVSISELLSPIQRIPCSSALPLPTKHPSSSRGFRDTQNLGEIRLGYQDTQDLGELKVLEILGTYEYNEILYTFSASLLPEPPHLSALHPPSSASPLSAFLP